MTLGKSCHRSCLAAAVATLLLLTGCANAGGPQAQAVEQAPVATTPAPSASPPLSVGPGRSSGAIGADGSTVRGLPVLPASVPVSLSIPSIGVRSSLLQLGLQRDGSLEVPPADPGSPAGWYSGSPTPGDRGPAVLMGHVNAYGGGPGVFARLRALKPGDIVEVAREDGTRAEFSVYRSEKYAKNAFPTTAVYGNTEGSELRVITCDGYNPASGEFDDNLVVYAKLLV